MKRFELLFILVFINGTLSAKTNFKALFVRKTKLFTKIANAHVLIPLDLNVFHHRIQSLTDLSAKINESFAEKHFEHLSKIDIREAKLVKDTLLMNIRITKQKIVEAQHYFDLRNHYLEKQSDHDKRQIIAGIIGVAGGLIYSTITEQEAISVIKKDQALISDTVKENILKISESQRDIKILNKTTEILKK